MFVFLVYAKNLRTELFYSRQAEHWQCAVIYDALWFPGYCLQET